MKKNLLLVSLAFSAAGFAFPASAALKTVVLSVPSMNCSSCPITVRKSLERVSGVVKVKTTYEPKEAVVTFDDAKTSVGKLTQATEQAGYPSNLKSAN